jgi:hypothetical protein
MLSSCRQEKAYIMAPSAKKYEVFARPPHSTVLINPALSLMVLFTSYRESYASMYCVLESPVVPISRHHTPGS